METHRYKALGYSLITVVWWVGVWGLAETIIGYLVKESLLLRLGIFLTMIAFVFLMVLVKPEFIEYL
jgi:low temperature requirement protein LtrA